MNSVTVTRFAGNVIPEDKIKNCLLNTSALGVGVAILQKGVKPHVAVQRVMLDKLPDQLKGVMALQEKYKDRDMVLHFSAPEEGASKDSLQPYPILHNADDKPILVAFIDGIDDAEALVKEDLHPVLVEAAETVAYDLEKLYEKCKGKLVSNAISGMRGGAEQSITLLLGNDQILYFGEEGQGHDYDWGWATADLDKLDAPEQKPVEEEAPIIKPEEQPKVDVEDDMMAALTGGAELPKPEAPKSQVHTTNTQARKVNTPAPKANPTTTEVEGGSADPGFKLESPPKGLRQRDLVKWVLARSETLPKGFQELYKEGKLSIPVAVQEVVKDLKDLGNTTAGKAVLAKSENTPLPASPKGATEGMAKLAEAETKVPILDPKLRKNIVDTFLKGRTVALLDKDGKDILDPALLKDFEDKQPSFAEQLGLPGMPATYHWTLDDFKTLGGMSVMALALCAKWYQHDLIVAQRKLSAKGKAEVQTHVETTVEEPEEKVVEQPAQQPVQTMRSRNRNRHAQVA